MGREQEKTHGSLLFRRAPVHLQKEEEKMSVLSKLASEYDRKDEEPNKDLGKDLVVVGSNSLNTA